MVAPPKRGLRSTSFDSGKQYGGSPAAMGCPLEISSPGTACRKTGESALGIKSAYPRRGSWNPSQAGSSGRHCFRGDSSGRWAGFEGGQSELGALLEFVQGSPPPAGWAAAAPPFKFSSAHRALKSGKFHGTRRKLSLGPIIVFQFQERAGAKKLRRLRMQFRPGEII